MGGGGAFGQPQPPAEPESLHLTYRGATIFESVVERSRRKWELLMPLPSDVLKVTHKGTIASDVWQVSQYFKPASTSPTVPIPAAFGTDVANKVRDMYIALAPYTSPMVTFIGVRLDWYSTGGALAASLDALPTLGSIPGTAAGNHPPQTCIVASLRTAAPGPRYRGRMYLPLLSGTVSTSTGLYPSADASSIATAVKNELAAVAALSSWGAAGWTPIVASQVAGGSYHAITAVKVGNVFDTQRRRRNKIIESYSTVSYP